jgi:hypothetical protein
MISRHIDITTPLRQRYCHKITPPSPPLADFRQLRHWYWLFHYAIANIDIDIFIDIDIAAILTLNI